jgi:hypothetical protein
MTGDFREPVIWLLLAIVARGIAEIITFILLDQDLIKHSQAEAAAGHELSAIYARLGQHLPAPDQDQVKRPDNYAGRILAAIFTFGIYIFWWFYNRWTSRTSTSPATGPRKTTSSTPSMRSAELPAGLIRRTRPAIGAEDAAN